MQLVKFPNNIIVRKLTEKDYEDVVNISKGIYDGYDHLVRSFKGWVNDPYHNVYGMEKEGELIGMTCWTIIDSGKTLLPEGERIKKEFRGSGLNSILNRGVEILFGEKMKTIIRKRWTTNHIYDIKIFEHFKMPRMFETFGTFNIESKQFINQHQNKYMMTQMDSQEFHELLKGKGFHYVITSYKVFENSLENLDILANGKFTQNSHQFWKTKDGFSLNCVRLLTKGDAYFVTIYSNDYEDFKNHLGFHFRKCINGTTDLFCLHGNYFMMKEYSTKHNLTLKVTYMYEQTLLKNKL